jgi:hypothetical protein
MGARTGSQFLEGLRKTKREIWVDGERIEDVTPIPSSEARPRAWPHNSTASTPTRPNVCLPTRKAESPPMSAT